MYTKKHNAIADNGKEFENDAAQAFHAHGYYVIWDRKHAPHATDLILEGKGGAEITVEVKGARPSKGRRAGTFRFCLNRANYSAPIAEDVVVLVCKISDAPEGKTFFVIPRKLLEGKSYIRITHPDPQKYAGRWSAFRDLFEIVGDLNPRVRRGDNEKITRQRRGARRGYRANGKGN